MVYHTDRVLEEMGGIVRLDRFKEPNMVRLGIVGSCYYL